MDAKDQARRVVEEWSDALTVTEDDRIAFVTRLNIEDLIARLTRIFQQAIDGRDVVQSGLEERAEKAEATVQRLRDALARMVSESRAKLEKSEAERDELPRRTRMKDDKEAREHTSVAGIPIEHHCPKCQAERDQAREQYDEEVWRHAACLSIAEGAPQWEQETTGDSPAMVAVRKLRSERDALVAAIQRGYCPEDSCEYGRRPWNTRHRITKHSPDCRVAPLLGGGKE
jgi:hypothetical protein